MKASVRHQAIIEETDSPRSTNSSSTRLHKKKKHDLMFMSKEDKIKLAITRSFGSLA